MSRPRLRRVPVRKALFVQRGEAPKDEPVWAGIHRAADSNFKSMARSFEAMLRVLRTASTGKIATSKTPLSQVPWDRSAAAFDRAVMPVLKKTFVAGAKAAEAQAPAIQKAEPDTILTGLFSVTDPGVQKWLGRHGAQLVKGIDMRTRKGLRDLLVRMERDGLAMPARRLLIQEAIGLDSRRAVSLVNLQEKLTRQGIAPAQIKRQVKAQGSRLIRARAETIARTETMNAAAAGKQETWRQARKQGVLAKNAEREWIVALDRVCPICEGLSGQRRKLDEKFVSKTDGSVHAREPAHPSCRCVTVLIFPGRKK